MVERFGRAGLVAQGALYAVVSILAIDVALGSRKESPDKNGALRTIAEQPFGKVLLTALAVGLAGYAAWQLSLAILDRENEGEDAKGLAKRATALARAGWYGVLCWLTVSTLVGNGSGNSNEQQKTAGIFDHTGGRYLVYAAGFAFLGTAGFNGYRAITCKFNKKLKQEEMNEAEEAVATGVGILGHLARCAVFGLIGIFLSRRPGSSTPRSEGSTAHCSSSPSSRTAGSSWGRSPSACSPTPSTASCRRATAVSSELQSSDGNDRRRRTLPFDWYANPDVLRLERERIFRNAWQYAGRADQVAEPGSFFTSDAAGVPIVVVRDKEGTVRAFLNVCRHRGSLVCEGEGGARRSSARITRGPTASTARSARPRAPSARRASTSRSSVSWPCRWMPGGRSSSSTRIPTHHRSRSISASCRPPRGRRPRPGSLRFLQRSTSEYEANWKVCCENFLECYHCQIAHPAFSKVVDVSVDAYVLEQSATFSTQYGPVREPGKATSIRAGRSRAASSTSSGRTSRSMSCPAIRTSRSARSCPSPRSAPAASSITSSARMSTTLGLPTCSSSTTRSARRTPLLVERVQKGLRSGGLEHGRLLLESERLLAHFQNQVVAALA